MNRRISLAITLLCLGSLCLGGRLRAQGFPPEEKAAFRKGLQILNLSGKHRAEDASTYGNLTLGMSEAAFKSSHPSASTFYNEPKVSYSSYVQGKGLRYQFWNKQLFALGVVISAFSNNEAGLATAQQSFDEAKARAEKLFGAPDGGLSRDHSDGDYQALTWVVWRGGRGDALTISIIRPKRLSDVTTTNGVATSMQIVDLKTANELSEAFPDMPANTRGLDKKLQRY